MGDEERFEEAPERSPAEGPVAAHAPAEGRAVDGVPAGAAPTDSASGGPQMRHREYRSRSERRMHRRAARRRKAMAHLGLVLGGTVIVVAAIVVLFALLGGSETEAEVTTTTVPAAAGETGVSGVGALALLMIGPGDGAAQDEAAGQGGAAAQGGAAPLAVLLHQRDTGGSDSGGTVLAIPGLTLLKTPEGFKTLAELHLAGQDQTLQTALAEALGVQTGPVASVEWAALRGVLEGMGIADLPAETLAGGAGEAEQVGQAVLALLSGSGAAEAGGAASGAAEGGAAESSAAPGAAAWSGLPLQGDAEGFRETMSALTPAIAAGDWTAAELPGRLVEGTGFAYLEPDVETAGALLEGTYQQLDITLQIQNGSGVVGIAQEAGELLVSLGYTMLPPGNSEDFPDVRRTRIEVAPDAAAQGRRVRSLLGMGTVSEKASLESGHVVVVLGKDYVP